LGKTSDRNAIGNRIFPVTLMQQFYFFLKQKYEALLGKIGVSYFCFIFYPIALLSAI